ncbi:glycosyltransferase-like domain-containing protein 1 isoform X2 [Ostrea edulis]|nr:glycosyltransferase-like domain-containing protein 1 isoform X2 [Ostrea edulis]XP_055995850.1 glycosyltransferase-like domain-containing protein 1 isoform X2 [Ostrea edulis]XP_055995851.1 glycosyltransferase-like domain-containing protein 1 isoform X2 [Ostrea edulis]XP_055995852.1 glycosyltransferase-like domain-containing protein 1 isoform X2 [Ostrea edulis]
MESFLSSIDQFLHILPDYRPKNLANQIRPKCQVIYFPVEETGVLPVNQDSQPTLSNPKSNSETQRLTANHSTDSQSTLSNQNSHSETQKLTANHSTDSQSTLSNQNSHSETQKLTANHSTDSQSTLSNQNSHSETQKLTANHSTDSQSMLSNQNSHSERQRLTANHSTDSERVPASQIRSLENEKLAAKQNENQIQDLVNPFAVPHQKRSIPEGQGSVPRHKLPDQLESPLHIVWAHRWEHDKGPELFFDTIKSLHKEGCQFKLSVLGEQFTDNLEVFETSRPFLENHIVNWGYLPSKSKFLRVLESADVAVSTALHEFFGVSMLEAVQMQCYPLCPNRLVYPEIYPKQYLYNTEKQLLKTLKRFCRHPKLVREHKVQVDISKFSWKERRMEFLDLFYTVKPHYLKLDGSKKILRDTQRFKISRVNAERISGLEL